MFLFCSYVNRNAGGSLPAQLALTSALCPGLHRKPGSDPAVRSSSGLGHADARMGQGTELPLGQARQPAHVSQMWEQRRKRDLRAAADGEDGRERQRIEGRRLMSADEWMPDKDPLMTQPVVTIDRRPLSERAKLSDRGLVHFRPVCDQMGLRDRESDTIRPGPLEG